jgi:hypothetical protein
MTRKADAEEMLISGRVRREQVLNHSTSTH